MEEILNNIINIDKKAREIAKEEKEKSQNIENVIEETFNIQKTKIDEMYKEQLQMQLDKYDEMFNNKKEEIDNIIRNEIEDIELRYRECENKIISDVLANLKINN